MVAPAYEGVPRGAPRAPYWRTYVLLPPQANAAWATAVVQATWNARRFTVGGSADDAGLGDLDCRCVIAVNPGGWADDLAAFFDQYYPGLLCLPIDAGSPAALKAALEVFVSPNQFPPQPEPPRGLPRVQYARTYVLLPPQAQREWATAAVEGGWDIARLTIGASADDAGLGDLDDRRVVAINPAGWGDDLAAFFDQYYPGVAYLALAADNTYQLRGRLRALCLHDRGVSLAYPTTRLPPLITDGFGVDRGTYLHNGLDLLCSWDRAGDEVLSATAGQVLVAGWNPTEPWYGFQVRVESTLPTGHAMLLRYAHLKEGGVYVHSGQWVERGDRLGQPDSTGVTATGAPSSTGDHLHLDVQVDGVYIDPAMLIEWPNR